MIIDTVMEPFRHPEENFLNKLLLVRVLTPIFLVLMYFGCFLAGAITRLYLGPNCGQLRTICTVSMIGQKVAGVLLVPAWFTLVLLYRYARSNYHEPGTRGPSDKNKSTDENEA